MEMVGGVFKMEMRMGAPSGDGNDEGSRIAARGSCAGAGVRLQWCLRCRWLCSYCCWQS
jgi:hypothetical protein